MNKLANEPIAVSTVAVIVGWVVARFAVDMDDTAVDAVALIIFVVGQWLARRFSTPVAKANKAIDFAFYADPTKNTKPTL